MGVNGLGADELPSPGAAALRIELRDAGLHRDAPRPRADTTVPAPGAPALQRRRHRRSPPSRIEPAASLPGPIQPGRITAGPPDGLLNLPCEAGRAGAHAADAASADPRTTTIPDLAGPEPEIVIIARHGMTIGSRAKTHKRLTVHIVA